jgi:hypothetical protein
LLVCTTGEDEGGRLKTGGTESLAVSMADERERVRYVSYTTHTDTHMSPEQGGIVSEFLIARIENGGGGRGKDKEGGLATHLDLLLPFLIRREPVPVVV